MSNPSKCRICDSPHLEKILSLGEMPLTAAFVRKEDLSRPEPLFPLNLAFCRCCGLVQLLETVPPDKIFGANYPYFSSFCAALLEHAKNHVEKLIESRHLNSRSFVVELASNDGYLLKNFVERGIPVLGIDPSEGPALAAKKAGIPTLCTFFNAELARELALARRADVIIANNVLAHVVDLHGFVEGIRLLLKDDGVAVLEMPYVRNLVDHREFDTIYHEHLCYYSATALEGLFRMHSLFLNHAERIAIHGGSLRIYVEPKENASQEIRALLEAEVRDKVQHIDYYRDFAQRVGQIRDQLRALMAGLKRQGARIAAYGAAAKGAILLNYCGMGAETIDFVADRNTHKQGLFMPGQHIPVVAPSELLARTPDFVLLLTWNFADEILEQQSEYRRRGGHFIIPIPQPTVV
jgi:SAM-dependent methyltransferase